MQRLVVLRIECAQPSRGLFRGAPMPGRRELRIEAAQGFVAPGTLGVCLPKDPPRLHEGDAGALRLLPRAMLSLAYTLGHALSGKLGAVVEREVRRHPQLELDDVGPVGVIGVEVVGGAFDLHHTRPDVTGQRVVKAKNFANAMSTELVTADEILPCITELDVEVQNNGTSCGRGSTAGMQHSIGEMAAYASLGERVVPGELLATGTIPGCSGMETGQWLAPGDEIELKIDGVGTLCNVVGTPAASG